MNQVWTGLNTLLSAGVAIPSLVLFGECLSALTTKHHKSVPTDIDTPSFNILIPAHNEAAVISDTLLGLIEQIDNPLDIVVVADNCTDDTATIARSHGVTVLERFDDVNKGKGFALDAGLAFIESTDDNLPDVVLMIDADCTVEQDGVLRIVQTVAETGRPTQAVYLQRPPSDPGMKDLVSTFAFRVKNLVRPRGLHNLGLPVLLTGSGMAFPFDVIRSMPLASGNIVEDMQLGIDLALGGHPPILEDRTTVWGELPSDETAATTQRTRWEHGHIHTLTTQVPRLLAGAFKQRRLGLFTLALEQSVPPLALLVLLWAGVFVVNCLSTLIGASWLPAIITGSAGVLLGFGTGIAWLKYGREIIPFRKLMAVPLYILWKIPLYVGYLFKRQTAWVRTAREETEQPDIQT